MAVADTWIQSINADAGADTRAAASSPRALHWAIFGLALAMLFGMRWVALNGVYKHPDEIIPQAVVAQMRASGSLDTNWEFADLPSVFRYPQYNFSGYIMAMHAVDTVRCAALDDERCEYSRPQALRQASTITMALVWLGTWLLARRLAGPWSAMLATLGVACSVQLYQDAIYARPEAFATALFLALLVIALQAARERVAVWVLAGITSGVLIATKISFLPMLVAAPILMACKSLRNATGTGGQRSWLALLSLFGGGLALGATLAAPHAWLHPDAVLHGVARLSTQYSTGHWPHGEPELALADRLLHGGKYLLATLGVCTTLLAIWGALSAARRKTAETVVLGSTVLFYVGYFSATAAFFERNFSHVLPLVCVFAAAGAVDLVTRLRPTRPISRLAVASMAMAALAWPGVDLSMRLYDAAVRGTYADLTVAERDRLAESCGCVRSEHITVDQAWRDPPLIAPDRSRQPADLLLMVADFGEPRSARGLEEIASTAGIREVGGLASPFATVPTSSLQIYHAASVRFFVVTRPRL